MGLYWHDDAWSDYLQWQNKDKKVFNKINSFIKDLQRNGINSRIGKSEKLKKIPRL